MRANPAITRKTLAENLGISDGGVKYHLDKLRKGGLIKHTGATKAGQWEVLDQQFQPSIPHSHLHFHSAQPSPHRFGSKF